MSKEIKKIGILTGGGDCPGLNAVIRAVTKSAILEYGYEVIGYKFGYKGLYTNDYEELTLKSVEDILKVGGTILCSSNKDNLFDYTVIENGNSIKKDVSDIAIENLKKNNVDALVIIGGDGTLTSARDFSRKGVNVIGVPKTIDNDLKDTDITFGFNTAVGIATEALDRLKTTAASHHRVILCEIMGRNAGWLTLEAGIAGDAHIILIPEIPFTFDNIAKVVNERNSRGELFTIIAISEGAKTIDGEATIAKIVEDSPDPIRYGGVSMVVANELEKRTNQNEVRATILGHVQRGGDTSSMDRILSTRYGVAAVDNISEGNFGKMVALRGRTVVTVPLEDVIGTTKLVDPNGELVKIAKKTGIKFGDE